MDMHRSIILGSKKKCRRVVLIHGVLIAQMSGIKFVMHQWRS
jgi:hypothetical protein